MPCTRRISRASPKQPSFSASTPSSRVLASSTTAAAPSPNSTATSRLFQSMKGEMSSAPTMSALRTTPVRISAVAVESP